MAGNTGRPKINGETKTESSRPKANSAATKTTSNKTRPNGNASKKARIVAEATETANRANRAKGVSASSISFDEPEINNVDLQANENVGGDAQVQEPSVDPVVTPVVDPVMGGVDGDVDLTIDADDLEPAQDKKKKKKGGVYDEGDLSNKKKKKRRKLLWLLLLLLLLLIVGVVVFKDILFPPKPIVIVPNGMVLKIKSTGQSQIGVDEFIFKPGDTIEFEEPLSVFSERYATNDDGTKGDELSPFTLRLRFYIEYEQDGIKEEHPEFIDVIHFSKTGLFTSYNDWFYYNAIVIPGALAVEIIDSIRLSESVIGNVWQNRMVSLVLEYQTICPESTDVLDEAFEYNYPPDWGYIVVEEYKDLKG